MQGAVICLRKAHYSVSATSDPRFYAIVLGKLDQVTVEELRGGMVVSGPQVHIAECMRLFAGGVIMAALGETWG